MTNWLQKISSSIVATSKGTTMPAVRQNQTPSTLRPFARETPALPNASVIYGVAASALFVFGLYFLFTGRWFTGALICAVGACFVGFALHFLKR